MNILVKFPTRGRPDLFFNTLDIYYKQASNFGKMHFLVSIDNNDPHMNTDKVIAKLTTYVNLSFHLGDSKNKIDAVNRDMNFAPDYDIILLASDDMIPQVHGYDEIIRKNMQECYPDTDGILFFNDGYRGKDLNTLCILGKKYYQRFNYIYNPEYLSLFADNEFMDLGWILNKQTYFDDVIIRHEHPEHGFHMQKDRIHELNEIHYVTDLMVYRKRKANNFYYYI